MSASAEDGEIWLGRYKLKRPLGKGGNGQVFLAGQKNESELLRPCVVKFPLVRNALDDEERERFIEEARFAMQLGNHPNIVHVTDVGRHLHMPFIVMEYVDAVDLRSILEHYREQGKRLPLAAIYNILTGAATGLHHAHVGANLAGEPFGIIHRDVKPANIMVTKDGIPKLADFGISTTIAAGTSGNYMRGTFRYMSPEHISREARPEMDIYALGVIAWEMVENREYREGFEGTEHVTAIMNGVAPPMEHPDTPAALAGVIRACLDPNPRQRPSAADLLRSLRQCPGYKADAADVRAVVAEIAGHRRSSGQTLHQLEVTPELAGVMRALEVAGRKRSSSRPTGPKVVVAGSARKADTTVQGPPAHSQQDAASKRPVAPGSAAAKDSEVDTSELETRKYRAPDDPVNDSESETRRRPAPSTPRPRRAPGAPEEDAPIHRRRPEKPRPLPLATVALSEAARLIDGQRPTVALKNLTPLKQGPPSTTERLPPPPAAPSPAALVTRGRTEPALSVTESPTTPGSIPVPVALRLETSGETSSELGRERRFRLLPLFLFCSSLAAGSALAVAYAMGAFEQRASPKAASPTSGDAEETDKPAPPRRQEHQAESVPPEPVVVIPPAPLDDTLTNLLAIADTETPPSGEAPSASTQRETAAERLHEPPTAREEPAKGRPDPHKAATPATVRVVLFLLDEAEVRIGRKAVILRRGTDVRVPAGRHRVRWRSTDEDAWHDAGRRLFSSNRRYMVRLSDSGTAEVVELDTDQEGRK